jgi:hypothetical protein
MVGADWGVVYGEGRGGGGSVGEGVVVVAALGRVREIGPPPPWGKGIPIVVCNFIAVAIGPRKAIGSRWSACSLKLVAKGML